MFSINCVNDVRLLSVNQTQQAPRTPNQKALGACFCWPLTARLGASDDRLLNGIQEAVGSQPLC
jgi:hypothetical protein